MKFIKQKNKSNQRIGDGDKYMKTLKLILIIILLSGCKTNKEKVSECKILEHLMYAFVHDCMTNTTSNLKVCEDKSIDFYCNYSHYAME